MTMIRKRSMTAAEHQKLLEQSPVWVARDLERQKQQHSNRDEFIAETTDLNAELRAAGFGVETVEDLHKLKEPYQSAIPILLKHISRAYSDRVGAAIASMLDVTNVEVDWDTVVSEYRNTPNKLSDGKNSLKKDGLANVLASIVSNATWNEFLEIIREKKNGSSRILMLRKVGKSKRGDSNDLLEEFLADPELAVEIGEIIKERQAAVRRREMAMGKKKLH
jgi:hypothetical protein